LNDKQENRVRISERQTLIFFQFCFFFSVPHCVRSSVLMNEQVSFGQNDAYFDEKRGFNIAWSEKTSRRRDQNKRLA